MMRLDYLCFEHKFCFNTNLLCFGSMKQQSPRRGLQHSTFLKWLVIDGYMMSGCCKDGCRHFFVSNKPRRYKPKVVIDIVHSHASWVGHLVHFTNDARHNIGRIKFI